MTAGAKIFVCCSSCNHPYRIAESFVGKTVTCRKCGTPFVVTDDRTLTECPMIGRLAFNSKFVSQEELRQALDLLKAERQQGRDTPLEQILVSGGMITRRQLDMLLTTQKFCEVREKDIQFGRQAIERGWTTGEAVDEALSEQSRLFRDQREIRLLGDILVARGDLARDKRDFILVGQDRMEDFQTGSQGTADGEAARKISLSLMVSPDKLLVTIQAREDCCPFLTVQEIKEYLHDQGITYGLKDDAAIEEYLQSGLPEREPFEIAAGKPPVPPTNATVSYSFDTELFAVGKLNEDGTIDFKERGEVPQVAPGDLLAEKSPMKPGEAGMTVYGEPIPVPKPRDVKLRCGTGAELSEDRNQVLAKIAGQPALSIDGKISVMAEVLYKGDIDLKTGNVYFDGNIRVKGSVQSEFKIRGGSLHAGEILAADIDVAGDVIVAGGIIGARIRAQGNVQAKYIKGASISAYGDVIAQKELIDSRIETSGACRVVRGKIISATVAARKGIEARDIGTEMAGPSRLYVGVEKHVEREISGLNKEIGSLQEMLAGLVMQFEALDARDKEIHKNIVQLAQVQDRAGIERRRMQAKLSDLEKEGNREALAQTRQALADSEAQSRQIQDRVTVLFGEQAKIQKQKKGLEEQIQALNQELENLQLKKEGIEEWVQQEKAFPVIKTSGVVYGGTIVYGVNASTVIKEPLRNFLIKEIHIMDPDAGSQWEIKLVPPR